MMGTNYTKQACYSRKMKRSLAKTRLGFGWWWFWWLVVGEWLSLIPGFDSLAIISWMGVCIWAGLVTLGTIKTSAGLQTGIRRFLFFLGWLGIVLVILGPIVLSDKLSFDAVVEIGCGLKQWQSLGSAWHGTCFLDYPARQFSLPSLVPLLLGRSIEAVNLGHSLYLIIGASMFWAGLWKRFGGKRAIFVLLILGLLLSNQQHWYYLWPSYEQAIYPMALGLFILGLWFHFENNLSWGWWGVVGLWAIHSYTVNLAWVGLLVGTFMIEAWVSRNRTVRTFVGSLIFGWSSSLLASLFYRGDLRLFDKAELMRTESVVTTIAKGLGLLMGLGQPVEVSTPIWGGSLVLTVFVLLGWAFRHRTNQQLNKRQWQSLGLAIWIIGVVFASLGLNGFVNYTPAFRLHRLLMLTPLVAVVCMWCCLECYRWFLKKQMELRGMARMLANVAGGLGWGLLLLLALLGARQVNAAYQQSRVPNNQVELQRMLVTTMGQNRVEQVELLVIDQRLQDVVATLPLVLDYFYPHAEMLVTNDGCHWVQTNELLEKMAVVVDAVGEDEPDCELGRDVGWRQLGSLQLYYQQQARLYGNGF